MKLSARLLLEAIILPGCDRPELVEAPTLWTEDEVAIERVWHTTRWDTGWARGGAEDTALLNPGLLRSGEAGPVLFDRASGQVLSFDDSGGLRWAYGRSGRGPGEFANVRDLRIDERGRVLVYDPVNQRITVLSPGGELVRFIPLPGIERGEHVAPAAEGIVVFTFAGEDPVVVLDSLGAVTRRTSLPWRDYGRLSPLVRQGLAVSDGHEWGYLFSIGNGWFRLSSDSTTARMYAEHTHFPTLITSTSGNRRTTRLAEQLPCSACSANLAGDTLSVHFGGYTSDRYRIVDQYHWATGKYLRSYLLPTRAQQVAIRGGIH